MLPRFIAMMISMPMLVAESISFGLLASYAVAVYGYGIPAPWFLSHMIDHTNEWDIVIGMIIGAMVAVQELAAPNEHKPLARALIALGERARARIDATTSTSFACDLKKWLQIMETYEGGGHAYHATMPTDALTRLREVMKETQAYGFDRVRAEQIDLGAKVRALFESRGIPSVAADGFKAPGVVVSYTTDPEIHNSKKFLAEGLQTAAGVPLQCDEPADFMTFRVGLFGLEKWHHVDRTVAHLAAALDRLGIGQGEKVAVAA